MPTLFSNQSRSNRVVASLRVLSRKSNVDGNTSFARGTSHEIKFVRSAHNPTKRETSTNELPRPGHPDSKARRTRSRLVFRPSLTKSLIFQFVRVVSLPPMRWNELFRVHARAIAFPFEIHAALDGRVDRTRRIASTAEGKLTGGSNRTPCGGDSGGSGGGDA